MGKLGIVQPDPPIIASGHARKISSDEDYAAVLMLIKRCANAASKVPAKEKFSGNYCPTPPADSAWLLRTFFQAVLCLLWPRPQILQWLLSCLSWQFFSLSWQYWSLPWQSCYTFDGVIIIFMHTFDGVIYIDLCLHDIGLDPKSCNGTICVFDDCDYAFDGFLQYFM